MEKLNTDTDFCAFAQVWIWNMTYDEEKAVHLFIRGVLQAMADL